MLNPSSWKDCKAWRDEGLPLTTSSDEAAKMIHATLWQNWCFTNDPSLGGTSGTLSAALEADPQCMMGLVLKSYGAYGVGVKRRSQIEANILEAEQLVKMSNELKANEREKMHCKAVFCEAHGKMNEACSIWERILIKYPRDSLALHMAFDHYIHAGLSIEMRDSTNRILPHYDPKELGYGYLLSLNSFAWEESGNYSKAEEVGKQALHLVPSNGWATHAMAHVYEMQNRTDEGIHFMQSTENNWKGSDMIALHDYWHWALFHVEKGEYEEALGIFDDCIQPIARQRGTAFSYQDMSSLLYRLELEGNNVDKRWSEVCQEWTPQSRGHVFAYNDAHLLMAYLGANDTDQRAEFIDSMEDYLSSTTLEDNQSVSAEVGWPLNQAMIAYKEGRFSECVETLNAVRYRIWRLGGSHAQRDVFSILLINAAMKSNDSEHRLLAKHLCAERKAWKTDSVMVDRWLKILND